MKPPRTVSSIVWLLCLLPVHSLLSNSAKLPVSPTYFTNTTEILVLYARYCGHHRLCNPDVVRFPVSTDLTKKYFNQCPECRCDHKCYQFGDCCLDKLLELEELHSESNSIPNNNKIGEDITLKSGNADESQTLDNLSEGLRMDTSSNAKHDLIRRQECVGKLAVVATCNKHEQNDLDDVLRCEQTQRYTAEAITRVPVLSVTSNTSYTNIFCAKCNGDSDDIEPWLAHVECDNKVNFGLYSGVNDFFNSSNTCGKKISFVPQITHDDVRYCNELASLKPNVVRCSVAYTTAGPKNKDIAIACGSMHMPFKYRDQVYKNVFCYHCNIQNASSENDVETTTATGLGKGWIIKNNRFVNISIPDHTTTRRPVPLTSTPLFTTAPTEMPSMPTTAESNNKQSTPGVTSPTPLASISTESSNTIDTTVYTTDATTAPRQTEKSETAAVASSGTTESTLSTRVDISQDFEQGLNATLEHTVQTKNVTENDISPPWQALLETLNANDGNISIAGNQNDIDPPSAGLSNTTIYKEQLSVIPNNDFSQSDQLITSIFGSNRTLDNFVKTLDPNADNITVDINDFLAFLNSSSIPQPPLSLDKQSPEQDTASELSNKPILVSGDMPKQFDFQQESGIPVARDVNIPWVQEKVPVFQELHNTDSCPKVDNASKYQLDLRWACDNFLEFGWDLPLTRFKNPFCCFCWRNKRECVQATSFSRLDTSRVMFSSESYRLLFDFSALFADKSAAGPPEACPVGQFLDTHTKRCREILCSSGRINVNDSCVPIVKDGSYLGYSTDITYITTVNASIQESDWKTIGQQIFLEYYNMISQSIPNILMPKRKAKAIVLSCNSIKAQKFVNKFLPHYHHNCLDEICSPIALINAKAKFVLPQKADRDEADKIMMSLETKHLNISQGVVEMELIPTTSDYLEIASVLESDSETGEKSSNLAKKTINTDAAHESSNCAQKIKLVNMKPSKVGNSEMKGMSFMEVHRLLICQQVELDSSEYTKVNESFIQVKYTKQLYSFMDYIKLTDGNILICKAGYEAWMANSTAAPEDEVSRAIEDAANVLAWVLTILSLLCLLITFVTYCVHVKLRTLPGKNNMFLAATLFGAQLFLFIGFQAEWEHIKCAVFGILTHYFWLAAFFSMNVCSFHMFRVFTGPILRSRYVQRERLIWYYINYILAAPLFIVAAAVITNLLMSDGMDFGYGIQICFLNGHRNVGLFFVLPIACMIILNIFYFTNAACKIMHAPKLDRNKRDTRDFFMYMKLFSITGITWIIQIVDSQFDIIYLRLISIVLNASQGVFIFFAFVWNKRVMGMYKEFPSGSLSLSTSRSKISMRTSSDEVFGSSFALARSSPKLTFSKSKPASSSTESAKSRTQISSSDDTTCDSAFCSSEVLTDTEAGNDINSTKDDSKSHDGPSQDHSATI